MTPTAFCSSVRTVWNASVTKSLNSSVALMSRSREPWTTRSRRQRKRDRYRSITKLEEAQRVISFMVYSRERFDSQDNRQDALQSEVEGRRSPADDRLHTLLIQPIDSIGEIMRHRNHHVCRTFDTGATVRQALFPILHQGVERRKKEEKGDEDEEEGEEDL